MDKPKTVGVVMPSELDHRLQYEADRRFTNKSTVIRQACVYYLNVFGAPISEDGGAVLINEKGMEA